MQGTGRAHLLALDVPPFQAGCHLHKMQKQDIVLVAHCIGTSLIPHCP